MQSTVEARKILGEGDPKQAYRRLAAVHHPDAGGDPEMFHRIRDAYEFLTKEEPTAEHELLVQLFLQELEPAGILMCLGKMEEKCYATLQEIPLKKAKLIAARPKARGFLVEALENAISSLEDDVKRAHTELSEISKARDLFKNLYI